MLLIPLFVSLMFFFFSDGVSGRKGIGILLGPTRENNDSKSNQHDAKRGKNNFTIRLLQIEELTNHNTPN